MPWQEKNNACEGNPSALILRIEKVRVYRFQSVNAAIAYFKMSNPARQKSFDPLDPEPKSHDKKPDFSGESPADIWASVCKAVDKVYKAGTQLEQQVFWLYFLDPRWSRRLGAKDVAKVLRISPRRVYKILDDTREDLEKELRYRELMPPDDE